MRFVHIFGSGFGIFVCLFLALSSAQFGFSRLLSRYGVLASSIPATSQAISLAPYDADAHRAQAIVFRNFRMYREARRELELAASLRPNDDYLWLDLGTIRDELDDTEAALHAFDQAVVNAPFYAHTRWQRANLRLRLGRYDEAFAELRDAARSNQKFLPVLIDLAWGLSHSDPKLTEQLAGIESPESRIAFARFLARKGLGKETVEQFRLTAPYISNENRRELVAQLIAMRAYKDAFEIWKPAANAADAKPVVYDGGFEGAVSFSETGFGWRVSQEPKLNISQDLTDNESGTKSLKIVFNGDLPLTQDVLSQIIPIRQQQKYRVNFALKTRKIVSGGLPVLVIADTANSTIIRSLDLESEQEVWRKQSVEFNVPPDCAAISLKLARRSCASSPCPIFGTMWLDSFSIEEITP